MNIRISSDGQTITAKLTDNATSRDFLSLLPLTLELEDYASTEKVAQLPRRLSTEGTPAAMTPRAGDFTYYAPRGNLAIFYNDGPHSPGLIKLGTLDSIDALRRSGRFVVTIGTVMARRPK